MSKDKSVKEELNSLLNQYIGDIKDSIKDNDDETLQAIFSAFLNNTYHRTKEYKPFIQNLFNIDSLLNQAPLTALSFISTKNRHYTVEELLEFQKEGQTLILNLAKQAPKEERGDKTKDCEKAATLTASYSRGSPQKVVGHFSGNIIQQPLNGNDRRK